MRRRWLVALALVGAAAGTTAAAGSAALSAERSLSRAQAGLTTVTDSDAGTDEALAALQRASRDVDRADARLDAWPVDVLAAIPVLGRSWDAERAVTRTAREVLAGASVLAERVPEVRARSGGVDLAALAAAREELAGPADRAQDALADLRSTSVGLTPPQVGRGVRDAEQALGPAVDTLRRAASGLEVVGGLLGGSGARRVLVMLQNNAELRGAGGYSSSFATGRLDGGSVVLGPLRDVLEAADPPATARRVPAPREYVEDYGGLSGDTTQWRSWNMSPHVPDSALVGARVAGALLGEEPDVVVLLDVPAMGALASLGGSGVQLPGGRTVTADELTQALLVDAYADAGSDVTVQVQRRADLQAAATGAVSRLLTGAVPAADAARTLARLTAQRHLTVWSARPQEQQVLEELGAAGALAAPEGGDLSSVSVNNIGSNKLDLYVDRAVSLDAVVDRDEAQVLQRVRFTNRAPDDLVSYVAGVERPGVSISRVELSLPPGATDVAATVDGAPWTGSLRAGQGRQRLATRLELPRGDTSLLEVSYRLPVEDGRYALRVVPQPLVRDAAVRLSVRSADGEPFGRIAGAERADGAVAETGTLSQVRDVVVEPPQEAGTWERVKRWWDSPVRLG